MIVHCIELGSHWWTRIAADADGHFVPGGSVFFNSTAIPRGASGKHWHRCWTIPGIVRFNVAGFPRATCQPTWSTSTRLPTELKPCAAQTGCSFVVLPFWCADRCVPGCRAQHHVRPDCVRIRLEDGGCAGRLRECQQRRAGDARAHAARWRHPNRRRNMADWVARWTDIPAARTTCPASAALRALSNSDTLEYDREPITNPESRCTSRR